MDEVVDFLGRFLAALHRARVARASEHSDAKVGRLLDQALAFVAPARVPLGLSRPPRCGARWFAQEAAEARRLRPELLFRVERYAHPALGEVFRAYVGDGNGPTRTRWDRNLYVARLGPGWDRPVGPGQQGALAIIGESLLCPSCWSTGTVRKRPCPECAGQGWLWLRGPDFELSGRALEVRRLLAPEDPEHRALYGREAAALRLTIGAQRRRAPVSPEPPARPGQTAAAGGPGRGRKAAAPRGSAPRPRGSGKR